MIFLHVAYTFMYDFVLSCVRETTYIIELFKDNKTPIYILWKLDM